VRSTETVWCVVVSPASLVPKVEEEKGVSNTCHMGRYVYIIPFPESSEILSLQTGQIVKSKHMADTAWLVPNALHTNL